MHTQWPIQCWKGIVVKWRQDELSTARQNKHQHISAYGHQKFAGSLTDQAHVVCACHTLSMELRMTTYDWCNKWWSRLGEGYSTHAHAHTCTHKHSAAGKPSPSVIYAAGKVLCTLEKAVFVAIRGCFVGHGSQSRRNPRVCFPPVHLHHQGERGTSFTQALNNRNRKCKSRSVSCKGRLITPVWKIKSNVSGKIKTV